MPTPRLLADRDRLTEAELPIVHFIRNIDCNAWQLKPATASPGVCRFCYRERNRVVTNQATVLRVLDVPRARRAACSTCCAPSRPPARQPVTELIEGPEPPVRVYTVDGATI